VRYPDSHPLDLSTADWEFAQTSIWSRLVGTFYVYLRNHLGWLMPPMESAYVQRSPARNLQRLKLAEVASTASKKELSLSAAVKSTDRSLSHLVAPQKCSLSDGTKARRSRSVDCVRDLGLAPV